MKRIKHMIYRHAPAFAFTWTVIIFILCATPGQYIPSADWLELLSFDKFVHAGMFFVLCTLLFLAAAKNGSRTTTISLYFLSAVAYGASLELMQAFWFSNRSADWKDMVANTFGCVMALLLSKKLIRFFSFAAR